METKYMQPVERMADGVEARPAPVRPAGADT